MNDDCCYKLYMHLNKTNGKVYIGQTKRSYLLRWKNGKGYDGCSQFVNAIKKYGWSGFEHIQLIEGLSKIEVDYFERFFIAFFDSQNPEFGYNLTAGGDECPMDNPVTRENHREAMKKRSADPEWQKKHRETMKKVHGDPNWREKQREGVKKRSANPEWQKKHREFLKKRSANPEWQKNVCEALKKMHGDPEWQKKVREANQKRSKPVLCVETKIVYDSLTEAAIAVDLKRPAPICMCCSGKRKTAGGYHWEYA